MKNQITQFDELKAELTTLVAPTLTMKVSDFLSGASAIEAAKAVKGLQKRIEDKRKVLVGPLNDQVKAINEYAKSIVGPLDKAEIHLKSQLSQFEHEQERIRQEKLRQAEEERRKREQELLAKQEAERAALASSAESETEAAEMFGADDDEPTAVQKVAELEKLQLAETARLSVEAKAQVHDINAGGIKNARKNWKCEATDLSQVPKEFLIITLNQPAILAAARGGLTEIPGVRLWQETTIAIGANTYVPELAGGRK